MNALLSAKLITLKRAHRIISSSDYNYGLTNGCFDIVHAGHVLCLDSAKNISKHLMVALDTDESVTKLKGEGRPINTFENRATVLCGLTSVDYVLPFNGDTISLLKALRPYYYFKGGDYDVSTLIETPVVEGYGGCSMCLPFHEGLSTTKTLEKINFSEKH
jgi:D-beta-D-heptose 7-phosphate kinase/D-beta-D-heptose 1-phosphate adenosyltransferase